VGAAVLTQANARQGRALGLLGGGRGGIINTVA